MAEPQRWAVILFSVSASHGCTWYVYDATEKPVASNIIGRCFVLCENAIFSEHFSYFTAYMLKLPDADDCTPLDVTPATRDEERYKPAGLHYPKCTWVPTANITKETKFTVAAVTDQPYGGPGRCWKVEVTLSPATAPALRLRYLPTASIFLLRSSGSG